MYMDSFVVNLGCMTDADMFMVDTPQLADAQHVSFVTGSKKIK